MPPPLIYDKVPPPQSDRLLRGFHLTTLTSFFEILLHNLFFSQNTHSLTDIFPHFGKLRFKISYFLQKEASKPERNLGF